jgi:hypothetical protein
VVAAGSSRTFTWRNYNIREANLLAELASHGLGGRWRGAGAECLMVLGWCVVVGGTGGHYHFLEIDNYFIGSTMVIDLE